MNQESLFKEETYMKKYMNYSIGYAIAAMVAGVFYREFTKFNGFTGVTALGKVHGHLMILGMVMFLLVALFSAHHDLKSQKAFRLFMKTYNVGLPLTAVMFVVRGIPQVLGLSLSKGVSAAISGIAGVGHILVGVGLISLLLAIKKVVKD